MDWRPTTVTQSFHRSTGDGHEVVFDRTADVSIGGVLARIGEIQSRFGVSGLLTSATPTPADFVPLGSEELVELATEETRKLAGDGVADALEATLLDALSVHTGDAGLGAVDGAAEATDVFFDGTTVFPVAGYEVGSRFGPRVDPIEGDHRVHRGIDVGAPEGTPIVAAGAGTITWAGERGTYGNLVIVEHDDHTETRYAHTATVSVDLGDRVEKGQVVGTVGSTGRSTGPHLHFETRIDGVAVDPLVWLRENASEGAL